MSAFKATIWLDLWVGADIATHAELMACEASITGKRLVIQNPAANYAVAEGPDPGWHMRAAIRRRHR